MDFNSPSSLVFHSSVKIVETLFCRQDLLYLEAKQLHLVGWVQVQDNVAQLVQSLELPKNVEENVQELIQPIGDQIRRWLSKRSFVARENVDLYNKFSWTCLGMIDYRKTAENLIRSRQLDVCIQFVLSHLDAVDDCALGIYRDPLKLSLVILEDNTIPVHGTDRKAQYEICLMMKDLIIRRFEDDLAAGNPDAMLNCPTLEPDFYESAINTSASNGNTALTRYFLTKLDPQKKAPLLKYQVLKILETNNRFVNLDTLVFLLNQMELREVCKLFIENNENILLRFLEWPLQSHFMSLASRLWIAMCPATFTSVLQAIVQHIIQHCSISINPFGYKDIFRDYWHTSPAEYRRICVNELIIPIMSSLFCSDGYYRTVTKLFGNDSYHEKLENLFYSNADAILEILSNENKAKAFEFIVKRYFSPDDIPLDFGEKYNIFTQKYLENYYGENDMAD